MRVTHSDLDHNAPTKSPMTLHVWRSGGLGDFIYMEPAIRKRNQRMILHAPAAYTDLWRRIGFDAFVPNETGKAPPGAPGLDLHWAVEKHPEDGWLDRVSIWEDIFGVPLGDDAPQVEFNRKRQDDLLELGGYRPGLPLLYYSPFTSCAGLGGRSSPVPVVNAMLDALLPWYNVVMLTQHPSWPDGLHLDGVMAGAATSDLKYLDMVASCDLCLSNDSGGLYVAAAAGLPCVGIYDHVPPWLRARRFPTIYSLYSRWPDCRCGHHDACTKPVDGTEPCKVFPVEEVLLALQDCEQQQGQVYSIWDHRTIPVIVPPTQAIRDVTGRSLVNVQKLRVLWELSRDVADLSGCAVEVGVYTGGSAYCLATWMRDKTLHLFDTMKGLPEPTEVDLHGQGEFAVDEDEVRGFLGGFSNIQWHVGEFPQTMPKGLKNVALAHCDCDLYESAKAFIERMVPLMVPGGCLVVDDYQWGPCPGITKAVDEAFPPDRIEVRTPGQAIVHF